MARHVIRDALKRAMPRRRLLAGGASRDNGPDGELIALCDRLVVIEMKHRGPYCGSGSPDDPDSDPVVGPQLDALEREWFEIMGRLVDMTPSTLCGARAVARAAWANAERDADWKVIIKDHQTRILFKAIGWLAKECVA